jgi:hypothetical protein
VGGLFVARLFSGPLIPAQLPDRTGGAAGRRRPGRSRSQTAVEGLFATQDADLIVPDAFGHSRVYEGCSAG